MTYGLTDGPAHGGGPASGPAASEGPASGAAASEDPGSHAPASDGATPNAADAGDEIAGLIGRSTRQRATVVETLMAVGDFTSAQALHARLRAQGLRVGLNTVYRTLTALAAAGRADLVHGPTGERHFRYRQRPGHEHYLVCRHCGLSMLLDTAPVETWADGVAAVTGFTEVSHILELTGTCAPCARGSDGDSR